MIAPRTRVHKFPAALPVLALSILAGCGGGDPADKAPVQTAQDDRRECEVRVDTSGWTAFTDLAQRITNGEPVTRAEMGGLGADPVWERWRASLDEEVDLHRIGNWVEATFWNELGHTGVQKRHPMRDAYIQSWRWSWNKREIVAARAAETAADACDLADLVERWISPERRPQEIILNILPTLPEFRYHEGELFIDTGFLAATPRRRLMNELVGLLYRNLETIEGDDPRRCTGGAAVAHTFRRMRNEGMAHWLEDTPHVYFFNDHPTFADVLVVPEYFWARAIISMGILNAELPAMWADRDRLEAAGFDLMQNLNTIFSHRNLGYAMVAVIAEYLGEDRLREASRTVPGFVAAFQEAVRRNAVPPPALEETDGAYYEAVPAFTPQAWSGLPDLLAEYFPD